jgi:choline dehydrogenase-like flavoprotein
MNSVVPHQLKTLEALADLTIPADAAPGGWKGGADQVLSDWATLERRQLLGAVQRVCVELERHAGPQSRFTDLTVTEQAALVRRICEDPGCSRDFNTVLALCMEGYYAGSLTHPPAGWKVTGFQPRPSDQAVAEETSVPGVAVADLRTDYDYAVIGGGAGGGVCAQVLSQSGAKVLLLERGQNLADAALRDDHVRGKRMALRDPVAGPGPGNPRLVRGPDGMESAFDANGPGFDWGLNAMVLGGGTRLWQGMAWRLAAADLQMASTYGVPDGSSQVDWPIDYDDLLPHYVAVETSLGVTAGLHTPDITSAEFAHLMPALPGDAVRELLASGASRLGWPVGPIPFAINSVPRAGRSACVACHQCMGHSCPVNARNGTHNTFIPDAHQHGADVLYGAHVTRIHHHNGTASSIDVVVSDSASTRHLTIRCGHVVVAAGAVETPRLLLSSGLGNDHVGKHLQGHALSMVAAVSPIELEPFSGPGHSVATTAAVHGDDAPAGGGVLFDLFSPYPHQYATLARALGAPASFGVEHKDWMRTKLSRVVGVMGIGHDVPTPDTAITLHLNLVDSHGVPAPVFTAREHPLTTANRRYLVERSVEWLNAAGCRDPRDVLSAFDAHQRRIPASEHSAGTTRMAHDEDAGATDPDGRLFGSSNVLVGDASLLPTNGGYNPGLTIMANARRVAGKWLGA